jgi:sugar lactone lactonase YvrE
MAEGLLTQNGLAWSPEGDRMYLSDSHPKARVVWAYDYDRDSGTPSNRRVFVDMNRFAGRPDGAAVDVDGCYWTCANDGSALLRFTPEGSLDRSLELPVKKPSMCAFGGKRLDTLYVTTIRPARLEDLASQPHAGAVFALRPACRASPKHLLEESHEENHPLAGPCRLRRLARVGRRYRGARLPLRECIRRTTRRRWRSRTWARSCPSAPAASWA